VFSKLYLAELLDHYSCTEISIGRVNTNILVLHQEVPSLRERWFQLLRLGKIKYSEGDVCVWLTFA
jgi:hypothetical protein